MTVLSITIYELAINVADPDLKGWSDEVNVKEEEAIKNPELDLTAIE